MSTEIIQTRQTSVTNFDQLKFFGIILGAILFVLGVSYVLFLRYNYSSIYQNLDEVEASIIVEELENREVNYRLGNGGRDISVPSSQADATRLGLLSSVSPGKNLDGFELFDDSEMGLTEFAQKIKYQRALQGEIARTLMVIDGIENARVHIAIPERALFRDSTGAPTASITIIGEQVAINNKELILGVQRLVAAAVPDLTLENVAVLNAEGRIISDSTDSSLIMENEYLQTSFAYKMWLEESLVSVFPEIEYTANVLVLPRSLTAAQIDDGEVIAKTEVENLTPPIRDYTVRIVLHTSDPFPQEQREIFSDVVFSALDMKQENGDALIFKDMPEKPSTILAQVPTKELEDKFNAGSISSSQSTAINALSKVERATSSLYPLVIALLASLLIGVSGVILLKRRRHTMTSHEHSEFAKLLQLQMQNHGEQE